MKIETVKMCVDNGLKVFNSSKAYEVKKDNLGQYLVICKHNNYTVGLEGMPQENYFVCNFEEIKKGDCHHG